MSETSAPTVSVVILAWGAEPVLEEAVTAVLQSTDVEVEVILVDNGCTTDAVEKLRPLGNVTVLSPGQNTGFAGGCNLGARHAAGEYLAFINGDAVVTPAALAHLVAALTDDVALSSASLRLYDSPETMNSAGNPVHFSGLSWAGGLGDPAWQHSSQTDITSATGAATAVRADRFAALGGFCELMFAYCEDTELSLRCWQRGWRVVYVPEAIVLHRYEFSRNDKKYYLLERNRWILLTTLYQARTLWTLGPALLGLELGITATAVRQGWSRQKVAGWWWLWRHRGILAQRRREVQAARVLDDGDLAPLITGDFAPGASTGLAAPAVARAVSRAYWSISRVLLRRSADRWPNSTLNDGSGFRTATRHTAERGEGRDRHAP
jgi:GT2 family glycosyltransferase